MSKTIRREPTEDRVAARASRIDAEQKNYMIYVDAIGRTVGHEASAAKARAACPSEWDAWRGSFTAAYGHDPATEFAAAA